MRLNNNLSIVSVSMIPATKIMELKIYLSPHVCHTSHVSQVPLEQNRQDSCQPCNNSREPWRNIVSLQKSSVQVLFLSILLIGIGIPINKILRSIYTVLNMQYIIFMNIFLFGYFHRALIIVGSFDCIMELAKKEPITSMCSSLESLGTNRSLRNLL